MPACSSQRIFLSLKFLLQRIADWRRVLQALVFATVALQPMRRLQQILKPGGNSTGKPKNLHCRNLPGAFP
jgi:hypothetical protein